MGAAVGATVGAAVGAAVGVAAAPMARARTERVLKNMVANGEGLSESLFIICKRKEDGK